MVSYHYFIFTDKIKKAQLTLHIGNQSWEERAPLMPRRAQCQENRCLPPPKIKPFFFSNPPPCAFHLDKSFVCRVASKQVSHECRMFYYFALFVLIHEICLGKHIWSILILEHSFIPEVSFMWVSPLWLCTLCCLWGKLVKVIQPTERLSHSPTTEGSMSLESGVEWT